MAVVNEGALKKMLKVSIVPFGVYSFICITLVNVSYLYWVGKNIMHILYYSVKIKNNIYVYVL